MIGAGAHVNMKDSTGNTPMHMAVASKNLPIIRILDDNGADARIKNQDNFSAIDVAITEDLREAKLHFMSKAKYRNCDFG